MSHFFVGFDQAAKALAEAVFVHFIEGVFIPQAAAVRRKLVAQHHFAFEQTKLQLKVHQNQTGVIEQFFQHVVGFVGQLAHPRQILFTHPAEGFAVGVVDHRIVHSIVFQEQVEQRRIQLDTFFNA